MAGHHRRPLLSSLSVAGVVTTVPATTGCCCSGRRPRVSSSATVGFFAVADSHGVTSTVTIHHIFSSWKTRTGVSLYLYIVAKRRATETSIAKQPLGLRIVAPSIVYYTIVTHLLIVKLAKEGQIMSPMERKMKNAAILIMIFVVLMTSQGMMKTGVDASCDLGYGSCPGACLSRGKCDSCCQKLGYVRGKCVLLGCNCCST
ncbi:hypothetical protein EJB05_38774, partial [Eragrostis curvula]